MPDINPLDILKRLDVKQNVTIRVIDEPTGKVVQEYIGHNAATNSLLTGIAHYLMGDGVLNQGSDTLSMWIPQYISLGTMGLTSQESEIITEGEGAEQVTYIVPKALGSTPVAPDYPESSEDEIELNARLRFTEYINQTPGFGADGYDSNTNNNRLWFGLGLPYTLKPDALKQNFYNWDGTSDTTVTLSETPISIVSITAYPGGEINQDSSNTSIERIEFTSNQYSVTGDQVTLYARGDLTPITRVAIIYTYETPDAENCELVQAELNTYNNIVPTTLRSKITYRDMVPEYQSEVPSTLDVVYSAMISTGALKAYRGNNDYIYITEAGLWSKPGYSDSGDNGLLAGYRITPSGFENEEIGAEDVFTGDGLQTSFLFTKTAIDINSVTINGEIITDYYFDRTYNQIIFNTAPADGATIYIVYKTTDSWMDMRIKANRQTLQKSILRVGVNQVVQVVWKLQLGGLEQLDGLRALYPAQYSEEVWTIV